MTQTFDGQALTAAMLRVAAALETQRDALQELDQASGDGDLGITAGKIAVALREYTRTPPGDDLGKYLAAAGMAINKVASSTMGTLLATALMRAGKEAKGLNSLSVEDLARLFSAADLGIQERGKAQLGDKTIVDALHPAAEAFRQAIEAGETLAAASVKSIAAAEAGRDSVTPLRSRIGRASWQGERTEGQVDPGCAALVILLKAVGSKE
jgi:phosphoenolpyruvate---glycerone phosphotransferase subunit DhaL